MSWPFQILGQLDELPVTGVGGVGDRGQISFGMSNLLSGRVMEDVMVGLLGFICTFLCILRSNVAERTNQPATVAPINGRPVLKKGCDSLIIILNNVVPLTLLTRHANFRFVNYNKNELGNCGRSVCKRATTPFLSSQRHSSHISLSWLCIAYIL